MAEPTAASTKKDGSRTYLDPVTGRQLRSVTTIKNILAKHFLPNHYAKMAGQRAVNEIDELNRRLEAATTKAKREEVRMWLSSAANQHMKAAGAKGTEVHEYAEARLNGLDVSIRDELEPYVTGYEAFIRDHEPEFAFTECTFMHDELFYGGTADFGASMFGTFGAVVIGDWKTGNTGPWLDWAYQLTAYSRGTHTLVKRCLDCMGENLHTLQCPRKSGTKVVRGFMPQVSQDRAAVIRLLPDKYELHWIGKGTDISMETLFVGFRSAIILDRIAQAAGSREEKAFKRG